MPSANVQRSLQLHKVRRALSIAVQTIQRELLKCNLALIMHECRSHFTDEVFTYNAKEIPKEHTAGINVVVRSLHTSFELNHKANPIRYIGL